MHIPFHLHNTETQPLFHFPAYQAKPVATMPNEVVASAEASGAPQCKIYMVDLPNCSLHVMEAGAGAPLIMVPATISELENWVSLVQFMAQWFHVYFFELPGHGKSTPFSKPFTTDLVAETVEQLADHIGAERFTLMGFSFGGILAMKSYKRLEPRIDRVILNAPCVTSRAVSLSPFRRRIVHRFMRVLRSPTFRSLMAFALKTPAVRAAIVRFFQLVGKLENGDKVESKLAQMRPALMDVISRELEDILTIQFNYPAQLHATPCHLTMSIHDPLLDFDTTLAELQSHFETVHVNRLYFPYHQAPEPFSFETLNRDYGHTARAFIGT